MKPFLFAFVIAAGALTAVESGANAKLTKTMGGPWWPAILFSLISLACLAVSAAVMGGPFPTGKLSSAPWWAWTGGAISAVYVMAMLIAPGQLGAGLFTGLTVTAAIVTSVALDHFGLVGFAVHTAGIGRLIGTALMVAGIVCVAVF